MHLMDDFQNSHVRRIVGADALTFWMIQHFTAKQTVSFLEVWTIKSAPGFIHLYWTCAFRRLC